LYLDGCPSHARLLPVLRALAGEYGLELTERCIEDAAQAERTRFIGSPSVRVNGVDVEPGAERRTDFAMSCRLYRSPDGQSGQPPEAWIRRALDRPAAR